MHILKWELYFGPFQQIAENLQEDPQILKCHFVFLHQRMDIQERQRSGPLAESKQRGSRIFSLWYDIIKLGWIHQSLHDRNADVFVQRRPFQCWWGEEEMDKVMVDNYIAKYCVKIVFFLLLSRAASFAYVQHITGSIGCIKQQKSS